MNIFLFIWFVVISQKYIYGATFGPQTGPVGQLDVRSFGTCSYKNTLKTSVIMDLTKPGKEKEVNGNITIPFDVDNSIIVKFNIHKWTGSEWTSIFKIEGPLCDYGKKYAKVFFTNFYKSLVPKVKPDCLVKKGQYQVKKFQALSRDISLPSIFYGKLKAEFKALKGKNEVACLSGEVDSKPP